MSHPQYFGLCLCFALLCELLLQYVWLLWILELIFMSLFLWCQLYDFPRCARTSDHTNIMFAELIVRAVAVLTRTKCCAEVIRVRHCKHMQSCARACKLCEVKKPVRVVWCGACIGGTSPFCRAPKCLDSIETRYCDRYCELWRVHLWNIAFCRAPKCLDRIEARYCDAVRVFALLVSILHVSVGALPSQRATKTQCC